ncbi:MAG: hypothetical protein C4520_02390 [Candidatus Abyssobacteria bacterium SURF_5]|uniref:Uncharacterized protein n=1 Tax=Abyssobacteria bacterium (strain SURF_5) TaxID=2093360 RepID=A0A3A4PBZ2_ABYX5|nr:MAG: hypothetical protein C4520_02390 [Candidatus Abyssubacteria bacterium SURF_5]
MERELVQSEKLIIAKEVEKQIFTRIQGRMIQDSSLPAPPKLALYKLGRVLRLLAAISVGVLMAFSSIYLIVLILIYIF